MPEDRMFKDIIPEDIIPKQQPDQVVFYKSN